MTEQYEYLIECSSWLKLASAYLVYLLETSPMSAESDAARMELDKLSANIGALINNLDAVKQSVVDASNASVEDKAALVDMQAKLAQLNADIVARAQV